MNFGFQGNQVLVSRKINLYNVIPGYSGASIFFNQLPVRERKQVYRGPWKSEVPLNFRGHRKWPTAAQRPPPQEAEAL